MIANPLCSKCGQDSWVITEQSIQETGLIRLVLKSDPRARNLTMTDAIYKSEWYKVLFLHCESCGYVINSSIETQEEF